MTTNGFNPDFIALPYLQREYINISFLHILEKKNICFLFKKRSDSNRSLCVEKEEKQTTTELYKCMIC